MAGGARGAYPNAMAALINAAMRHFSLVACATRVLAAEVGDIGGEVASEMVVDGQTTKSGQVSDYASSSSCL